MDNLHDLFEHELKDIYDAETRLVEALGKQAKESTDPQIKTGFEKHRKETQGQLERLEKVFAIWGREADRGEGCAGIQGLIEEHDHFVKEKPAAEILDVFNLTAAMKVESYEIVAYESLIRLGTQMDLVDAVELLEANLAEEEKTLEKIEVLLDAEGRFDIAETKKDKAQTATRSKR